MRTKKISKCLSVVTYNDTSRIQENDIFFSLASVFDDSEADEEVDRILASPTSGGDEGEEVGCIIYNQQISLKLKNFNH